jgi:surface antigen
LSPPSRFERGDRFLAADEQRDDAVRENDDVAQRQDGSSVLGGIARGALGRFGGGAAANIIAPMGSMLGDAVMRLLDCDEQRQAATATEQATQRAERGGAGASASWQSETRPGVSGISTVTSVDNGTPDGDCMSVSDIVIIDGQETEVPKRMCRRPPNNRFVRV